METDNKRKIIMAVSLAFVGLVLLGNLYSLISIIVTKDSKYFTTDIIVTCFSCIALASAVVYVFAGFKKTSAKYFKFFLYAFILSEVITLLYLSLIAKTSIFIIISIFIPFILLNVLFGTKDLGRKMSLVLSISILACTFFTMIFSMFTVPNYVMRIFVWNLADLSLAVVLVVMMYLKYYDKALRKGQTKENG